MFMFEVVDRFLLSGSINVLKHTMPVSRPKLVSDGPESLIVTGSQQRTDAVLLTSSGSSNSADADESFGDTAQAGSDLRVEETVSEEVVRPGEEHGGASLAVGEEGKIQPPAATGVVPDPQLSGSDLPNICDVATTSVSTDNSSAVRDELTVQSCEAGINQDDSDEKEIDELRHSEDRSFNRTADEEETSDMNQLDTSKPHTDQDDAIELPSEKDTAAGCNEEPDHLSTNDQTFDLRDTLASETITAEPSLDTNISLVDSENNEETLLLEEAAVTVLVRGIPCGLDETVEMYLESEKKGGGKILSFEYNKGNGSALVVFADNRGDLFACFLLTQLSK